MDSALTLFSSSYSKSQYFNRIGISDFQRYNRRITRIYFEPKKRLQDIIDKSVGGIVSLSRPAQADRTSFIEDQFEANLTIKDTLRLVHPTKGTRTFIWQC